MGDGGGGNTHLKGKDRGGTGTGSGTGTGTGTGFRHLVKGRLLAAHLTAEGRRPHPRRGSWGKGRACVGV